MQQRRQPGPTNTLGEGTGTGGRPSYQQGTLDYIHCRRCDIWFAPEAGGYCSQCGAHLGRPQTEQRRKTLHAASVRPLANPVGQEQPALQHWWLPVHPHRPGPRRLVWSRIYRLRVWHTGGRLIVYGAVGFFLLLVLVQLIHLAQVAVTLVTLLVVLRLLGFFGHRW